MSAVFIMIAGMGIIGVLASLMSSLLLGGGKEEEDKPASTKDPEIEALKSEVAEMRELLERIASGMALKP